MLACRLSFAQVKGDDVGIIIVVQEPSVDVQQIRIRAEDKVQVDHPVIRRSDNLLMQELLQLSFLLQRKADVGGVKADRHVRSWRKTNDSPPKPVHLPAAEPAPAHRL